MPWPQAHDAFLRDCHRNAISIDQTVAAINAAFGTQYTRGAVSGRRNKLGLTIPRMAAKLKRALHPKAKPEKSPPESFYAPVKGRDFVEFTNDEDADTTIQRVLDGPIGLLDLRAGMCRYPFGHQPPFTFCGAPQVDGHSYCAAHCRMAYRLLAERAA